MKINDPCILQGFFQEEKMIYFLYGDIPLQLKYENLIEKLKKENPNISETFFDSSQDESDIIFQKLSSNNMFVLKELIIIKKLDEMKNLSNFLKGLKEFNYSKKILILLYKEILNDFGMAKNKIPSNVLKAAEKICKVISARKSDEKKSLIFYIKDNLNCSDYDAEKFIEIVGEDYSKLKNEIEKVNIFLNGDSFDLEKVIGILSVSKEFNLNMLVENLIYKKKKEKLILTLKNTKDYMLFLNVISEEISILIKLKDLEERGLINGAMNFNLFKNEVYPKLKEIFKNKKNYIHPYSLFLKFQYLKLFNLSFLEKKLKECLKAEFYFKSGLIENYSSIELFILNFDN